jgi:hypothetical protein
MGAPSHARHAMGAPSHARHEMGALSHARHLMPFLPQASSITFGMDVGVGGRDGRGRGPSGIEHHLPARCLLDD